MIANPINDAFGGEWLHPYSLVFEVLAGGRQVLFPAVVALWGAASGNGLGIAIAAGIFILQLTAACFRFFTLRYRITDNELIVQKGLVFRSIRKVPLCRIQNIDLVQNPLHRLLRVAEVKIETASGSEPEAVLRVLSVPKVDALRHGIFDVLRTARSESLGTPQGTSIALQGEAAFPTGNELPTGGPSIDDGAISEGLESVVKPLIDERLVYAIPTHRLVLAGLTSNQGFLLVSVLIGAVYELNAIQGVRLQQIRSWEFTDWNWQRWLAFVAIVLPIAFVAMRLLSAVWFVLKFQGYRMTRVGKDLRIRCGLFTKIAATIPMERIQLISIQSTWSLRRLGLATIRVETAGGGGTENENTAEVVGRRWFLPAIRQCDLVGVLAEVHPGLEWNEKEFPWRGLSKNAPTRMLRLAIVLEVVFIIAGLIAWFPWGGLVALIALPILIWRAHKKAKSMRYFRTKELIGYRSGTLTRKVSVAFLEKIQCVVWNQSPFDRRWDMANLSIDTAGSGPADHKIKVEMLDAAFAHREVQSLELVLR